uniref:tRNA:m(4)X modification enzyme TRM13 n=1 Tax=Haemonchus contortus TaxID=6289 RepID=A0A7I4YRK8_HAECO
MVLGIAHFDAHCGRGSAKLMCALYYSGHGPTIPRLTRTLQADLKELRNFVTDIHNDRQTERQTDRTTDETLYTFGESNKERILEQMRCKYTVRQHDTGTNKQQLDERSECILSNCI